MDIPRKIGPSRRRRQFIYAALGLGVLGTVTMGVMTMKPAVPTVQRGSVWIDSVKRGPMLRRVSAPGTLVPVDILWIPATIGGRVDHIFVLPGTNVKPGTVLLELANPELQQETLEAEWKLKAAQADYSNLKVQLESQVLSQKSEAAKARTEYSQARMQSDVDSELNKLGVISDLSVKISKSKAQELETRDDIEQQRLTNSGKVLEAQLLSKRAEVEQLRALAALKETQLRSLHVMAGIAGVLQEQQLKVGQWVTPGTTLAKVVQPEKLKAQLRVAEVQAKDVRLDQPASIDTHNGVIAGHVSRIDPAVQNGTVTVDISVDGTLPSGARPDLSVEGTIDLDRIADTLYVGRPALSQENGTATLFKVLPDGHAALRVQVKLGRASVHSVEIVNGLQAGDQVILSDMSRWDNFDRVHLE